MSGTISKVFIDSSALIETYKGSPLSFQNSFFDNPSYSFFINDIVISEFLYFFAGSVKGISPVTLKRYGGVGVAMDIYRSNPVLEKYMFLPSHSDMLKNVPALMKQHNLLPNDAIILATCLIHQIPKLASLDLDFRTACIAEGIEFIHPGSI